MRFISRFFLPVALIVISTSVVLVSGLLWLTAQQDRMEAQRETQLVKASLGAEIDLLRTVGLDYAVWDDMVRNTVFALDREWLDANAGGYVRDAYGVDRVVALDGQGQPVYSITTDHPRLGIRPAELGTALARASKAIADDPTGERRIAGVTLTAECPAMFAISAIRPSSDQISLPPGPRHQLFMLKMIDRAVLKDLAARTPGLTLAMNETADPAGHGILQIVTTAGEPAGTLTWEPLHPGMALRRDVLPWVGLLLVLVIGLASWVLHHAWNAARELVAGEARSRHMAHHDPLTGLPNRRAFTEHLLQLSRANMSYALLYMDLDGFKEVNDAFGHLAGDRLLKRTAERLARATTGGAFLARLGGDEFAIVVNGSPSKTDLDALADLLVTRVRLPHEFGSEPIVVGASIGIAICDGAQEYEESVRRADIAMYVAKARGRNRWCHYEPEFDDGRRERKLLEGELRRALNAGDIAVVYQPIVRTSDRKVMAMEALARWTHPAKGPISPDVFIPVAEETGAIVELGRYVLEVACRAALDWPYRLAVNLSPAQFWDGNLVESVLAVLEKTGFPANRLEFEITETYLLRRPEAAAEVISALRTHGIHVALDDFGTGYASIGYLRRFELDLVKLDRSFVEHVAHNSEAAEIAQAVIALGGALKLPILAEGVETEEQAAILATAGCSFMQGWHYGHPVPAEAIDGSIAEGERIRA